MALESVRTVRLLLALVLPLAVACPGPNPPPADTAAPTTRAEPRGGSFNAPVSVTLSCSDEGGSGCTATHYTMDGSQPTSASPRYTEPLRFTATTTLRFFSVDGAGNSEEVKTEQYTLDIPAPTVSAAPPAGTYRSPQTITLSCTAATGVSCTSIRYTTDGSTPTASSTLYTTPIPVATTTTLRFFAVDALNRASTVVSAAYVIDTAAPTVSASPAGGTYRAAQTVTLSCDDGAGSGCATLRYTTNGSDPTTSSPAYTGPLTINSSTTLKFSATDVAGNDSGVVTASYVIDAAAPTVTADVASGTYDSARTVTLSCNDGVGGSGCAATRYTTDGSDPTAASPAYTGPLTISSDTTLKFFATDVAGNASGVVTRSYFIDTAPPTTTASPPTSVYATTQTVTLTCNDGTGIGCAATYYAINDVPDTNSTRYTAPIPIPVSGSRLSFFSVDQFGRQETVQDMVYLYKDPASISAEITAVRASPSSTPDLVIDIVLVTYIKPRVGTEPTGFFIQAEQAGPALFIAVDPTRFNVAVGDRIRLRAAQKTTVEGMVHVTSITGYDTYALGERVEPMRADVSNVNLPALLDNHESELISLSGTLSGGVSAPANGFVTAPLSTTGAPSSPNLLLRLTETLQGQLNLRSGCNITVRAPLWRSNAQALVTAWRAEDIIVHSCPSN